VILLSGFTDDPTYGAYLRGALLMNRIDLHRPIGEWLDVVYALWVTGPHEVLKKARQVIDQHAVVVAPDRDTWGTQPEHLAQMGGLSQVLKE
jgi:hypothetical protein